MVNVAPLGEFSPGALGADRSAVLFDDVLADGQAEPQPADLPRGAAVGLTEAIKHIRQKPRRNAAPRIAHHDARHRVLARQPRYFFGVGGALLFQMS